MNVKFLDHSGKNSDVISNYSGAWDKDRVEELFEYMEGALRVVFGGMSGYMSVSIHFADPTGNWRRYRELVYSADDSRELVPLVRLMGLWMTEVYTQSYVSGANADIIFRRVCTRLARQVEGLTDRGVELMPYPSARLQVPMLRLLSGSKPFPR